MAFSAGLLLLVGQSCLNLKFLFDKWKLCIMIPCKFVFAFEGSGSSDSLVHTADMHAVPRVGDKICFVDRERQVEVKEITHNINFTEKIHEIIVYYGDYS